MKIIYSTRRAILDTIGGQPNPFKGIIRDMAEYRDQLTPIKINDPDYQGFEIPEKVWSRYMALTERDYWTWIFTIATACQTSEYQKSALEDVFCALKADASIEEYPVPTDMPHATFEDEEGNVTHRNFADWYQNPPGTGRKYVENGEVLLLTNTHGRNLNHSELLTLKTFADNNPELNIEFLNHEAYLSEVENIQ